MKADRVLCRVAVGLAVIALVGLSVHLLGERPEGFRAPGVAPQAVPDGSSDESGDIAGLLNELLGPTAVLTSAAVPMAPIVSAPSLPPLEMFTSDEPLEAGSNTAAELVALQGQVGNGLSGSIVSSASTGPIMIGQQVVQEAQSMIEASVAALLAHTDPFF